MESSSGYSIFEIYSISIFLGDYFRCTIYFVVMSSSLKPLSLAGSYLAATWASYYFRSMSYLVSALFCTRGEMISGCVADMRSWCFVTLWIINVLSPPSASFKSIIARWCMGSTLFSRF